MATINISDELHSALTDRHGAILAAGMVITFDEMIDRILTLGAYAYEVNLNEQPFQAEFDLELNRICFHMERTGDLIKDGTMWKVKSEFRDHAERIRTGQLDDDDQQ